MAYTFKHGDRPLDGVTIQRAVGRGGFGEVYYALADSGKQIALKYLRENPEVELRGISHVMNLKSPHLISIFDVKHNPAGESFVLMEYVTGPSLRELMNVEPQGMGVQKAAFFLGGIAKGLSYLHERGIVHRDLKPGNIFFDDGYVKIGDYGLSKHIAVSAHSGNTVSVGTVHYMAPEIGSGSYSKAIDIYALGVILFEMLTGRLPFAGSSMGEILMRHLTDNPNTAGIPEPFAGVIARAMAKNPADRYQSVDAMVDAIMSAGGISTELASFDPASLTHTRRDAEAVDADRTMTTPPVRARVPALDARDIPRGPAIGAAVIPDIPPMPGEARQAAQRATAPGATQPRGRERWPTILTMAVITISVSGGLYLLAGEGPDEIPVAMALMLAGATAGALVNHFALSHRIVGGDGFPGRFMSAACGFVGMIPGLLVAQDINSREVGALAIPLLAVLFLFDIRKRIESGRRGKVNGGDAFMPGFAGFIAASMARGGGLAWISAVLCATMAILLQLGGSLFPIDMRAARRRDERDDDTSVWLNRGESRPQHARAAPIADLPPIPTLPQSPHVPSQAAGQVAAAAAHIERKLGPTAMRDDSAYGAPSWQRTVCKLLSVVAIVFAAMGFATLASGGRSHMANGVGMIVTGFALSRFFKWKSRQVGPQPLWDGTLRPLIAALLIGAAGSMLGTLMFGLNQHAVQAAFILAGCLVAASVVSKMRGSNPIETAPQSLTDVARPGIFARIASMGFAFVGQLLLLVGAAGTLAFIGAGHHEGGDDGEQIVSVMSHQSGTSNGVSLAPFEFRDGNKRVYVQDGRVMLSQSGVTRQIGEVRPVLVLVPLAIGSVLVVLARRVDGAAHVVRGMVGCGAIIAAAVLAVGPASNAISQFIASRDWSNLDEEVVAPAAIVGGLLGISFVTLCWPKRRPGQQSATIVV